MIILSVIFLVFVILIGAFCLFLFIDTKLEKKKSARKRIEQLERFEQLLVLSKQGNTEADDELLTHCDKYGVNYRYETLYPEVYERLQTRVRAIRKIRYQQKYLPQLQETYDTYCSTTSTAERLVALREFLIKCNNCFEYETASEFCTSVGFTIDRGKIELTELLQTHTDDLATKAKTSHEAFEELHLIRNELYAYYGRGAYQGYINQITFPASWNDLVARYIKNPARSTFNGMRDPRDIPRGEIRRMAAEAVRDADFTKAKIALSYCNAHTNILAEVGDVLTAELARLVTIREAQLSQEVTAENE